MTQTNSESAVRRPPSTVHRRIVALAGGVGGAKFAHGLAQILPPEDLTVIVNTGDDFEHYGLYICPDLDTVCYTLAGLANPETGWGRMEETWNAIGDASKLGGPDWFRLGDQDLGTHLERTRRLKEGQTLSHITKHFCKAWGVEATVLPMSDQPVRTIVETEEGDLAFQEYFVRRRCEPHVKGFRFEGVELAEPAPGAREALQSADAVILCPSNPWVSIDPIIKVLSPLLPPLHPPIFAGANCMPGEKNRGENGGTERGRARAYAISPIIGGQTVKGPAAKMFRELGIEPSARAVADHYCHLINGFVLDQIDEQLKGEISVNMSTMVTDTLMKDVHDRSRLAQEVLDFIEAEL